ncbi:MAG: copper resistance protein CopC [Caldilineaceae bacterium]
MLKQRRIGWLAFCLLLLAIDFTPQRALAHARVLRSDPADSTVLAKPPKEVRVWFDTPFLPSFIAAQVLDVHGRAVGTVDAEQDRVDKNLLVLTLPDLTPGVYSVAYRVISADDAHFTQGRLVLGVGAGAAVKGNAAAADQRTDWAFGEVFLRWLNFTTLAALIGALAMLAWVLRPAAQQAALSSGATFQIVQQRVWGWAVLSGLLALLVGFALLAWQVIELAPPDAGVTQGLAAGWRFLSSSRWGALWFARQAILLGLTVATLLRYRRAQGGTQAESTWFTSDGFLALLALALLIGQALSSHALALPANLVPALLADLLHLAAASLWMGGLLALAVGLLPLLGRAKPASALGAEPEVYALVRAGWRPFSRLAVASVLVLGLTGLYSLGRQVASLDALLTTLYGQALLAKMALVLLVGCFGLGNACLLHPPVAARLARLLHRQPGWTPLAFRHFPTLVIAEISLGCLVLLTTGLLTSTPPAHGLEFVPQPSVQTSLSQLAADLLVTLDIKPNRPGPNVITVHVANTRKPAPAPLIRTSAQFTFPGASGASPVLAATEVEPGIYQFGGDYLSRTGDWQVTVVVQRQGRPDSVASFTWRVGPAVSPRPVVFSNRPLEPMLTLLVGAVGLALTGWLLGAWLKQRRFTLFPARVILVAQTQVGRDKE